MELYTNMINKHHSLHEAMQIVLLEANDKTMHAADLADVIYKRNLYRQKNGGKAQYNQIWARCGHYPEMFETLPGNIIKLREVYLRCINRQQKYRDHLDSGKYANTKGLKLALE